MSVRCNKCGNENSESASFCSACGAAVTSTAPETPGTTGASGWGPVAASMPKQHGQTPHSGANHPLLVPGLMPNGRDPRTDTIFAREEIAGWGARFGAFIINQILIAVFGIALFVVGYIVAYTLDPDLPDAASNDTLTDEQSIIFGALIIVGTLVFLVGLLLWEILWLRSSAMAKPGQLLAGFRVVNIEGQRISSGQAWGRVGGKLIESVGNQFCSAMLIADAFTIGMTERRQSVHDMVCGTLCIKKDALERRAAEAASGINHASAGPHVGGPGMPG